jgi:hypothetical protein
MTSEEPREETNHFPLKKKKKKKKIHFSYGVL